MCRDAFQQSEEWLRDSTPPPLDVAENLLASFPADLYAWTNNGREESITACLRARAANCHNDSQWRNARVMDYLRSIRN